MKYQHLLFDLDGTLTDPAEGITNAVIYALRQYDIAVKDKRELYRFIGPPLPDSFEQYYGFSKEKAQQAVEHYRAYYTDKGIFENFVYEGVPTLLKKLKGRGFSLMVATSKPEAFAKRILEHFDLAQYFTCIAGSNLDGSRAGKDEVIEDALERCHLVDRFGVVMIGDRKYDVIGAKKVGIDSIGVLFGYGDRSELEHAGADYIVDTVDDLERVLLP